MLHSLIGENWIFRFSMHVKHGHPFSERVLSVKADVDEIALFPFPFGKAAIVIQLLAVLNDERNHAKAEAFLERDHPSDPAVAILKPIE